jgi:hypothetical protein
MKPPEPIMQIVIGLIGLPSRSSLVEEGEDMLTSSMRIEDGERVSLHLMQHVVLFKISSFARNVNNIFTRCVQGKGTENW